MRRIGAEDSAVEMVDLASDDDDDDNDDDSELLYSYDSNSRSGDGDDDDDDDCEDDEDDDGSVSSDLGISDTEVERLQQSALSRPRQTRAHATSGTASGAASSNVAAAVMSRTSRGMSVELCRSPSLVSEDEDDEDFRPSGSDDDDDDDESVSEPLQSTPRHPSRALSSEPPPSSLAIFSRTRARVPEVDDDVDDLMWDLDLPLGPLLDQNEEDEGVLYQQFLAEVTGEGMTSMSGDDDDNDDDYNFMSDLLRMRLSPMFQADKDAEYNTGARIPRREVRKLLVSSVADSIPDPYRAAPRARRARYKLTVVPHETEHLRRNPYSLPHRAESARLAPSLFTSAHRQRLRQQLRLYLQLLVQVMTLSTFDRASRPVAPTIAALIQELHSLGAGLRADGSLAVRALTAEGTPEPAPHNALSAIPDLATARLLASVIADGGPAVPAMGAISSSLISALAQIAPQHSLCESYARATPFGSVLNLHPSRRRAALRSLARNALRRKTVIAEMRRALFFSFDPEWSYTPIRSQFTPAEDTLLTTGILYFGFTSPEYIAWTLLPTKPVKTLRNRIRNAVAGKVPSCTNLMALRKLVSIRSSCPELWSRLVQSKSKRLLPLPEAVDRLAAMLPQLPPAIRWLIAIFPRRGDIFGLLPLPPSRRRKRKRAPSIAGVAAKALHRLDGSAHPVPSPTLAAIPPDDVRHVSPGSHPMPFLPFDVDLSPASLARHTSYVLEVEASLAILREREEQRARALRPVPAAAEEVVLSDDDDDDNTHGGANSAGPREWTAEENKSILRWAKAHGTDLAVHH
ncbi:uncharacterized protein AMSG_04482 [Thecamonas trahens ATCC 50062]|uniref:Uncharacterized protein n=1 Tax=Thecamonas trahens ATCC 50062 TaxID=461836 RepID=A0A0L0D7S0_THETB|nr:hypothetical protein AMSG_04482 [Thecamonas trahens ATCC 50062]KNC48250.1 hypothetical protein AMSG_04482 [Thecamonas trahens ATCC 50062]|eukprot:XP_013758819.1 hypothetical protein AMSG_04482 [Thecamonas trahens ATCC 50062]